MSWQVLLWMLWVLKFIFAKNVSNIGDFVAKAATYAQNYNNGAFQESFFQSSAIKVFITLAPVVFCRKYVQESNSLSTFTTPKLTWMSVHNYFE
jgi:hypothetical protein